MFHYISWSIQRIEDNIVLIATPTFGIQALYAGAQKNKGDFFLFPYMEENLKTISYFAFDSLQDKKTFEQMLKISWVWPKTAFGIANMDQKVLQSAVESFDVKPLQAIPWVWPKTAKRLLVELKTTLTKNDVAKLAIDEKLFKAIVASLKVYWYDATTIKRELRNCPIALQKENMQEIIKWLISAL